jgi:hypothetical protein
MIKDPGLSWDGEFPYDVLAEAGITPLATQDEVRRASFTLMKKRMMTPRVRVAWDELRDPERRMIADFLLYDLDVAAEIAAVAETTRRNLASADVAGADVAGADVAGADAAGADADDEAGPVRALSVTTDLWDEPDPRSLLPEGLADTPEELAAFMAAAFPDSLITFDR